MVSRISFSNVHLELGDITAHYSDSEASLKLYFSPYSKYYEERFSGYTIDELNEELSVRIEELSHTSSLSLLAALEAAFRIDYLQRNYKRKKDPLSKAFRAIYKDKEDKASLERDIFDAWKANVHDLSQVIGYLKGLFNYRHWLAHGRYWQPKGLSINNLNIYIIHAIIFVCIKKRKLVYKKNTCRSSQYWTNNRDDYGQRRKLNR